MKSQNITGNTIGRAGHLIWLMDEDRRVIWLRHQIPKPSMIRAGLSKSRWSTRLGHVSLNGGKPVIREQRQ
jgi:hypothetical protein